MKVLPFILISALGFLFSFASSQIGKHEKRIELLESQVSELQKAIAAKQ